MSYSLKARVQKRKSSETSHEPASKRSPSLAPSFLPPSSLSDTTAAPSSCSTPTRRLFKAEIAGTPCPAVADDLDFWDGIVHDLTQDDLLPSQPSPFGGKVSSSMKIQDCRTSSKTGADGTNEHNIVLSRAFHTPSHKDNVSAKGRLTTAGLPPKHISPPPSRAFKMPPDEDDIIHLSNLIPSHSDAFDSGLQPEEDVVSESILLDEPLGPLTYVSRADIRQAARLIFNEFSRDDLGCSAEKHANDLKAHLDKVDDDDNHYDLSATYETDAAFITPHPSHDHIGLDANIFPVTGGEARARFTNGSTLGELFTGVPTEGGKPRNICLHQEFRPTVHPAIETDIDSLIVFPSSLTDFKADIEFCFTRQVQFNINANLHLTRSVSYRDSDGLTKTSKLPISAIPQLYLGSVPQFKNSAIFLCCPALIDVHKKNNTFLLNKTAQNFFDQLLAACREHLPPGLVSHLPPSSLVAEDKARAKGVEHQSHTHERGLHQHRNYPIPAKSYAAIWKSLQTCFTDVDLGLQCFQDAFLLVDVKNTKLHFRSSTSLLHTIQLFEVAFYNAFHQNGCEFFVDLAKEICPPQPRGSNKRIPKNNETDSDSVDASALSEDYPDDFQDAVVYLWKSCCLQELHNRFVTGPFGNKKGKRQFYTNGLLWESKSMTMEPPKRSKLHLAGVVYAQYYACVKEIEDAQKVRPFDHEHLHKLAVEARLYNAAGFGESRSTLIKSYMGSKDRVRRSYRASNHTAFGLRFEWRISGKILTAIKRLAEETPVTFDRLPDNPSYAWAIPTATFGDFMIGNYVKLTTAIDVSVATAPQTGISKEKSRLLLALLRCLRNFQNCNPARESLLWFTAQPDEDGKIRRGLGFDDTLSECGYAWWKPIVDWERLAITEEHEGDYRSFDTWIIPYYRTSARLMQDTEALLTVCYDQLLAPRTTLDQQDRALKAMAHFIIRQYRRDVLDVLASKQELRQAMSRDEDKDMICFSFKGFSDVLTDGHPHLAASNRTKASKPEQVFDWLMGTGAAWDRKYMDGYNGGNAKPWRSMVLRAREILGPDDALHQRFVAGMRWEWYTYMWVFPYPGAGSCISTATKKGGRRVFWSGVSRSNRWAFGQGQHRAGIPPTWPATLKMNDTELRHYILGTR